MDICDKPQEEVVVCCLVAGLLIQNVVTTATSELVVQTLHRCFSSYPDFNILPNYVYCTDYGVLAWSG